MTTYSPCPTTRPQREALKRIFDRSPINSVMRATGMETRSTPYTYLEFRRTAYWPCRKDDCVMVWWKGMWLGIEPDGYTHS